MTELDAQVRFGFTTIFGTNPSGGGSCPLATAGTLADNVTPALNNATAIKTKYDGLAWPVESRLFDARQEVRVARDATRSRRPPRRCRPTPRPATSTSSSSPTGRRTTATTRSRSARPTPPSARCRPPSRRRSRRSSSASRRRSSTCPAAVLDAFANAGAGRADRRVRAVRPRCDRDLRPVPGRHALAHRPDRVRPPDHARADGGGGDLRGRRRDRPSRSSRAPPTRTCW